MSLFQAPLSPRQGRTLKVVIVSRISSTLQDPRSLADQQTKCREYLADGYAGKIEYKILATQGSGECLDRSELRELEELIESRAYDLVVCEDLSRICRRARAMDFCELCLDNNTRMIAINDRVDTAIEGWQDSAFIATWHHERSNRDTSQRIRRSHHNRFQNGGMIPCQIFGYIRPPGAKSDLELQKDPEAAPIISEIFRRLEDGASYAEIADWLNESGVPTGPAARTVRRWNRQVVQRFVTNPILKGTRCRNRKISRRNNRTGRHVAVKADPKDLKTRECPHLAFLDPGYYDHVMRLVKERNRQRSANRAAQDHKRKGIPRKRTSFPAQHAVCGVCGRVMWWSQCGGEPALLCSGAHDYLCWNSLYMIKSRVISPIADALLDELSQLDQFDAVFSEELRQELEESQNSRKDETKKIERQIAQAESRQKNLLDCIEYGNAESVALFMRRLEELSEEISEWKYQLQQLASQPAAKIVLPTREELLSLARDVFRRMLADDAEAQRIVCRLVPGMVIALYHLCDCNGVYPRAHLTVNFAALLPQSVQQLTTNPEIWTRQIVVNLFAEPQRVRYLREILALKQRRTPHRAIARQLGLKQAAVLNALRLNDEMRRLGVSDPYVLASQIPEGSRLRRHRHRRFCFEPLDGFPWVPDIE